MKLSASIHFAVAALAVLYATSALANDDLSERYANAYQQYADATCPLAADDMKHFVYFARDRDAIHDHALLSNDRFAGAQIMYPWKEIETAEGQYDFSAIQADVDYLAQHGKRLFIQLQDGSFSPQYKPVPDYLMSSEYDGGVAPMHTDDGTLDGWVAKRWNPEVQVRFAALLAELGKEFDGKIEGINLQETATGVTEETDHSFTPALYAESLKVNMLALKSAFPTSTTMIYANFMAGEWLPWDDRGYLRGIYEFGEQNGIGIGAPDLMFQRKGQLNHALAMMHEHSYSVPLGIAVQDGNYIGTTASNEVVASRKNLVPALHAFAQDFLKVNYMFWVDQEPYFEEDVLPCFDNR